MRQNFVMNFGLEIENLRIQLKIVIRRHLLKTGFKDFLLIQTHDWYQTLLQWI